MKECFLGVGTPSQAPVDVLYAIAKVSDEDDPYIPMCMSGWQNGAISDLEIWNSVNGFPIGFAAVWLSLTEEKVYEIDIDFSDSMMKDVAKIIKKGVKNKRGESVGFTHFKASFFPGGEVRFHLLSNGKIQALDYVFRAKSTTEYNRAFLEQLGEKTKVRNIGDYCNIYYLSDEREDTETSLKKRTYFVNDIALPNKLWKNYYTRYNYEICFVFENPHSYLYAWTPKFTNAESYSCQSGVNDDVIIKYPSALCSLNLWWRSNWDQYTSYFFFKEEEVMSLFEKAFASHPDEKGELIVVVGKYDNSFEVVLHAGNDYYPLRNTEIRVFSDYFEEPSDEGELIYKNYEGNCQNHFIGL